MLLLLLVVFGFTVVLPAVAATVYSITTREERAMKIQAAKLKLREAEMQLEYKQIELEEHRYRKAIGK